MAFVKTADLVTRNENTYTSVEEWKAEHGECGVSNTNYITDGSMTLNEAGNGVRIVLKYVDEATADSHKDAFADEIAAKNYDVTIVSAETVDE